jgi:hypothetical protein
MSCAHYIDPTVEESRYVHRNHRLHPHTCSEIIVSYHHLFIGWE